MLRLYCIEFPNGKRYIGITVQTLKVRLSGHLTSAAPMLVTKAIRKYRHQLVIKELLIGPNKLVANLEPVFIKEWNTLYPSGYNLRSGGHETGFCDDTRRRMSVSAKEREQRPDYAAHKKQLGQSVWSTPEGRAKMIEGLRRAWSDPEIRARRLKTARSTEVRDKIGAASKAAWARGRKNG